MNIELVKRMLDACYLAKRAREMLPPLPNGVMPSYIQYIDVINKLERQLNKLQHKGEARRAATSVKDANFVEEVEEE